MSKLSFNKLTRKSNTKTQRKSKNKINRFNGLTEEEIQQNSYPLPDYLARDLDLIFVGINPSLTAAYKKRYYAGPGNHFYKLLSESGLISRSVSFEEDYKLLEFGIGLTNIVDRATRSSADLSKEEIKEGSTRVEKKLCEFKPKIAVFNGRCIYDVFANKTGKSDFNFGLQPERIGDTSIWVVPSSSARCSTFPRMIDKLKFYLSLKKYLLFLKGEICNVDVREFYFPGHKQSTLNPIEVKRYKDISPFFNKRNPTKNDVNLQINTCLVSNNDNRLRQMSAKRKFVNQDFLSDNSADKSSAKSNPGEKSCEENSTESPLRKKRRHTSECRILARQNCSLNNSQILAKDDKDIDFVSIIKQRLEDRKRMQEKRETSSRKSE